MVPTITFTPIEESMATATMESFAVFPVPPLREGEVCGEFTPVPQKGWMGYPEDFEPAAYIRVFSIQEAITLDLVVVELGIFAKSGEFKNIDGKTVYFYDGQSPFVVHSAIRLQDAPDKIQETLKNRATITAIEIVDLQNNPLPLLPDEKSIQDITYVVDRSMPHPLLDIALPCPGFIEGHPINYSSLWGNP